MDRGDWRATIHGVANCRTQLSMWCMTYNAAYTHTQCMVTTFKLINMLSPHMIIIF